MSMLSGCQRDQMRSDPDRRRAVLFWVGRVGAMAALGIWGWWVTMVLRPDRPIAWGDPWVVGVVAEAIGVWTLCLVSINLVCGFRGKPPMGAYQIPVLAAMLYITMNIHEGMVGRIELPRNWWDVPSARSRATAAICRDDLYARRERAWKHAARNPKDAVAFLTFVLMQNDPLDRSDFSELLKGGKFAKSAEQVGCALAAPFVTSPETQELVKRLTSANIGEPNGNR